MNSDTVFKPDYAGASVNVAKGSVSGSAATNSTNFFLWRVCAWAGPVFIGGFLLFWAIIAGFFPPPLENWSTSQVVDFFTKNDLRIMIGMVGVLFVAPTYFVWSAVISRVMERMNGRDSVLPNIELLGGVTTAIVSQFLAVPWLAASFHISTRTPDEIQMLYDIGWIIFNVTFAVTAMQFTSFGIAILTDKRTVPLFPRWLAWVTFAAEATFFAELLMVFLPSSPFAWNGMFSYYVALTAFFIWQILTCYYLFEAITKVENEASVA